MSNQCLLVFFDIEGIVHKEFVPPRQMVNGKFFGTFWGEWGKISRQVAQLLDPASQQWSSFRKHKSSPTLPTHVTSSPVIFSSSQKWNWSLSWSLRADVLRALKRSRLNHRTRWRRWSKITSNSAPDHGNPTGITVSM